MLLVVGGHSRNIGKTSVAEALIRSFPKHEWTAVKITQFGHGVCSRSGEVCECAAEPDHPYALNEEYEPGSSDSGRLLAAGARRSFWLRAPQGRLEGALPAFRKILAGSRNTLVESNSIVEFVQPDLYLVVLDFGCEDFKPSTLRFLDRADAFIVVDRGINVPSWNAVARSAWDHQPQFRVQPPHYVSAEFSAFVRGQLLKRSPAA